ncbi:serine-threonine protein kinase, putative [Entamoeba invadens IP1]|uniref:Serine-threonine protein kinase, putative n=1 Tax=Entamoeba invadens IP1 TaxID=370355 RepID=A0A0A1U6S3_ENTIV|nr:serine-threonine protein kinase, putative [Entamoeba invadens IP1]ELP90118.1 serine-threonine protein kinase, putative [Entamoeba invadens IP1]|eukprot:XP_004256889.1 serine-threonine protein kinase, putative [Entamoeba invadens IP1]
MSLLMILLFGCAYADEYCVRTTTAEICPNTTNIANCISYLSTGDCNICSVGYFASYDACELCPDDCSACGFNGTCTSCKQDFVLQDGGCVYAENCELIVDSKCVLCSNNTILNDSQCIASASECVLSSPKGCDVLPLDTSSYENVNVNCPANELFLENQRCEATPTCSLISNNYCDTCPINSTSNKYACFSIPHCSQYSQGRCVLCDDGYVTTDQNTNCEIRQEECIKVQHGSCVLCSEKYFVNERSLCSQCPVGCSTCLSAESCGSCEETYTKMGENCVKTGCLMYDSNNICVDCRRGYFLKNGDCEECSYGCKSCETNSTFCDECKTGYYLTQQKECVLSNTITGCAGNYSMSGCLVCATGYYLDNWLCSKCSINCDSCYNTTYCTQCDATSYLVNGTCVLSKAMTGCMTKSGLGCQKCFTGYKLSSNGTCKRVVNTSLMIAISLVVFVVVIGVVLLEAVKCRNVINTSKNKILDINTSPMSSNSEKYTKIEELLFDHNKIDFDDIKGLPVKWETTRLITVANPTKQIFVLYFLQHEDSKKNFMFRTEPESTFLRPNRECEFKIFIQPLCTCKVNETIDVVLVPQTTKSPHIVKLPIEFSTQFFADNLDSNEIETTETVIDHEYATTYKGVYRGVNVVIKKFKNISGYESAKQFRCEATTACWFTSQYLVNCIGAVTSNQVFETVNQYYTNGNLKQFITSKAEMSDTSRRSVSKCCLEGILYLHKNKVFHGNLKPENVLIEIDDDGLANARLCDYNSKMTTEYILSHLDDKNVELIYLAPELLHHEKYDLPSDIYSLAMIIYTSLNWALIVPSKNFNTNWEVVEFMEQNHKLPQEKIPDENFNVLVEMWNGVPKERPSAERLQNKFSF